MKPSQNTNAAFTLIELLASVAILGVMMALLFSALNQTSKAWLQGESRVETFSSARAALDYMSRELAQAMVNSNSLQFFGTTNAVAFIAPSDDRAGDSVDLAEVVYRLSWRAPNGDATGLFTNTAPPYKLMRRSSVYSAPPTSDGWDYGQNQSCGTAAWDFYSPNKPNWMETSNSNRVGVLAENIMSLTFTYVSTNGIQYPYWNSTNVATVWNNELGTGIPYNNKDINNDPGTDGPLAGPLLMTNHAPAGVIITIGAVDSHTATLLRTLAPKGTNAPNVNIGAYTNIMNQATKYFTTFVEIPNQ